MGAMAYQISCRVIVYSTVYSGADQRKHLSSASLAFVWRIHRWPVNSPHKWPVTRKMFPFDDVIMITQNNPDGVHIFPCGRQEAVHLEMSIQCVPLSWKTRTSAFCIIYDDVITWKIFRVTGRFVRGIHRPPVNSPHKDQWRGTLMFSLICVWINDWVNNREAGDLRRYRSHYDVTVMPYHGWWCPGDTSGQGISSDGIELPTSQFQVSAPEQISTKMWISRTDIGETNILYKHIA